MVNEHERDLFGRVGECQIQSCDMKYSWTFIKRPPSPERGVIQTGNGLNLPVKMASEGVE